jgi:hypothetical protein
MRTKTLLLTAAAVAAGTISAMAQNVYSVNVVGYVNVVLTNGFTLVANPLNAATNDLNTLFPNANFGDTIYTWDSGATTFTPSIFAGTWSPDVMLNPGQGAFYQGSATMTNTFVGEVSQGALTNSYPAGFSLIGNQVPMTATSMDSLGLTNVSFGDTVYFWRGSTYVPVIYAGTWGSGSAPAVGEGFWLNAAAPGSWTQNFTAQ